MGIVGLSAVVALIDSVNFPFGIAVSSAVAAICGIVASVQLRSVVALWCSGAGIAFERSAGATATAAGATAGFWVVVTCFADMGAALPAVLTLSTVAVWCAVVDQATMRIPTPAAYTAAALTLVLIIIAGLVDSSGSSVGRAVAGGIATALIYLIVAGLSGGGIGLGDVRLSLSLGTVLGYQSWGSVGAGLVLPIIVMFPLAIFAVVRRRWTHHVDASREMAAGPALVASCALALVLNS